jgi:hypothetical protein
MPFLRLLLVLLLVVTFASASSSSSFAGQQFLVTSLPGLASMPTSFRTFSGYITVDAARGRALFFMFAEASARAPSSAPLVVWFTGGPGCSSLMAQFQENGPFAVNSPGVVTLNPWAWNRVANVLWIESPAGVGFSYSNYARQTTHFPAFPGKTDFVPTFERARLPTFGLPTFGGSHYRLQTQITDFGVGLQYCGFR